MRNQFRFDDKRNEANMLKDFLEKNAVDVIDEAMYQEPPEEVIVYDWEDQQG